MMQHGTNMKKPNPYRTFHLVQDDSEGRFTYWCEASQTWLYPHEFLESLSAPQPTTYKVAELPARILELRAKGYNPYSLPSAPEKKSKRK